LSSKEENESLCEKWSRALTVSRYHFVTRYIISKFFPSLECPRKIDITYISVWVMDNSRLRPWERCGSYLGKTRFSAKRKKHCLSISIYFAAHIHETKDRWYQIALSSNLDRRIQTSLFFFSENQFSVLFPRTFCLIITQLIYFVC